MMFYSFNTGLLTTVHSNGRVGFFPVGKTLEIGISIVRIAGIVILNDWGVSGFINEPRVFGSWISCSIYFKKEHGSTIVSAVSCGTIALFLAIILQYLDSNVKPNFKII